ncbi:hypothetical protein T484DRAFT_1756551 [Baffinella frigidus]|nr:hypothetical protein T484DRAFT_1756551 [Cryptophyta sp. CCMP2293]
MARAPKGTAAAPNHTPEQVAAAALLAKETAKLSEKMLKDLPITKLRSFHIRNPEEMDAALAHYDQEGFVAVSIFASEALRQNFCERSTMSIWNGTLRSCAYTHAINCAVPYITTQSDIDAMRGVFKGSARCKQLEKMAGKTPFPNKSFGAPAFGSSFNIPEMCELRADAFLAGFAQRAFGADSNVHYTIDRPINKLPGNGLIEFMHVDRMAWSTTSDQEAQVMHGKMVVSDGGTFICCPKSHLQEDEITRLYKPLYPHTSGMKFQLDPTKDDPLDIYTRTRKFAIDPGVMVFWASGLYHGVTENTSGRVQQGFYMGFQSEVSRDMYHRQTGVGEVTDRYNWWRFGTAPKGYPSGDRVHLYPKAWKNYPKIMANYLSKIDHASPFFDFSYREMATKKGVMTKDLKEVPDPDYIPVKLSQLSRAMLVGREDVKNFDFSLA